MSSTMSPVVPAAGKAPRHLLHVFPTFGLGGVPIRIANVINHFGDRFRHSIVAMDSTYDCGRRLNKGLPVSLIDHDIAGGMASTILNIRRMLKSMRPDLLLTYNWGAIEWGLANRVFRLTRHVHFESGFGPDEAATQLRRRIMFRRIALARADRIVVPSRSLVDLATKVWRLDRASIRHIPNGVDCTRFGVAGDAGAIAGLHRREGELIVGTVAPLRPEKNLVRLVRAFARLGRANVRLVVVGEGRERPVIEAAAAEHGIGDRVLLTGYIDTPEDIFGCLDLFAMSSDTEQMPNSLLQAMAASRAVVSTDVGDIRHMLSPENHPFVVPMADEAALANAMGRLLDDRDLRDRLGRANRAHVRDQYDQQRMFDAYGAIFEL